MVCTNGIASGPRLSGKWTCRMSPSRGRYGTRLVGSLNLRGGTSTSFASGTRVPGGASSVTRVPEAKLVERSEEHTSELQSPCNLVCRLLLEKKKKMRFNEQLDASTARAMN